jgi:hypothetical protein
MFALHVVIGFLAAFGGWLALERDRAWLAALLAAAVGTLIILDVARVRALRRLRQVALEGVITEGRVVARRYCRVSPAPRADGAFPGTGLPLSRRLEVIYEFEDDRAMPYRGRFCATPREAPFYAPGSRLEIFYLADQPAANVTSLVLRWYYRLGGPAMTDEAPIDDWSLDGDVIVEDMKDS